MQVIGSKCTVTLETEAGEVFTGVAHVAQIEEMPGELIDVTAKGDMHRSYLEGYSSSWSMQLSGLGESPLWHGTQKQHLGRIETKRSRAEWRCEYCGSVMPREYRKCIQCAAPRSFIYEM